MKIEFKITADVEIDQKKYPNITPEMILDGIRIYESDVIDGFEVTTSINGLDNTSDFFLKNAAIEEKHLILDEDLNEAPRMKTQRENIILKAIVQYKDDTVIIKFPSDYDISKQLLSVGIEKKAGDIHISDNEDDEIRVKLYSDSDLGNKLIPLFHEDSTLVTVRVAVDLLTKASVEVKEQMETDIVFDYYTDIQEVFAHVKELLDDIERNMAKFYFPLSGEVDEGNGNMYTVGDAFLCSVEEDIKKILDEVNSRDKKNMAEYYDGDEELKAKLISADWDLEYKGDMFYGVVTVKTTEPITPQETEKIKEFISGQNDSGIGESVESQGIDTEDGMLFVSFWHGGDDYFIYTEKEMDAFVENQNGQSMGGI